MNRSSIWIADHLADHEVIGRVAAAEGVERHRLEPFAFERRRGLGHTRRLDQSGGRGFRPACSISLSPRGRTAEVAFICSRRS